MHTLRPMDLNFVCSRIPKDIRKLMMENSRLSIAGGFIRSTISGEKPSDIDMFGESKDFLKSVAYQFAVSRKGRVHETENALTILAPPRIPVQFITRWLFQNPESVVASFDFTVCQAAIWYDSGKWHSAVSEDFYPDLAAHRLVYTFPVREESAGGSMMRVKKFLMRGFTIQAPALAGVISRIVEAVDIKRTSDHGVSVLKVVTGILREVDPLVIVDGIDFIDEHEQVNYHTGELQNDGEETNGTHEQTN